uniref:Uncharacterized protein n=1 Tax=Nicotiana tabacum TaxID=4097 RepID=A0A1S4CN88_TOBAC|nr:PREDICTED: uncharacterized protein LOC107820902 [Nicotiana tabacum]
MFLQQRSKVNWFKLEDDNTKYFYAVIKHRKLQKANVQLTDEENIVQTEPEAIINIFVRFYKDLLGRKERCKTMAFTSFLRSGHTLSVDQQLELVREYTGKELKHVMFSIDINKSPDLDGYSSDFFKKAWSIVGEDVTKAVL